MRGAILVALAALPLLLGAPRAGAFEPLAEGRDALFSDLEIDLRFFEDFFPDRGGELALVTSAPLEPANPDITDLYYPVWMNESIIFLAQNRDRSYSFVEYTVGSGTVYVDEMRLQGEGGSSDSFFESGLLSDSEDEPPLRNPVVNPDTGTVAFLLYEQYPEPTYTVCTADLAGDATVNRLYEVSGGKSIGSVSWLDRNTLVFVEVRSSRDSAVFTLDVSSGSARERAVDYAKPAASYNRSRIAVVAREGRDDRVYILDDSFRVVEETDVRGRITNMSWDDSGSYLAVLVTGSRGPEIVIWDSSRGSVSDVGTSVFVPEVGAIYLDYAPVWDSAGNLYFAVREFDFATTINRFDPRTGDMTEVYDFGDSFRSISAFDVSGFDDTAQVVICGLSRSSGRQRTAEIFFFNGSINR